MPILNPMTGQPVAPRFTVPDIFGQGMSYADQLNMLIAWVADQLSQADYVTNEQLQASISGLNSALTSYIDAGDERNATALATAISDVMDIINDIATAGLGWDMSTGAYIDVPNAARRNAMLFGPLVISVTTLNSLSYTVSTLSVCGLNCTGLAAAGVHLSEPSAYPTVPAKYTTIESE